MQNLIFMSVALLPILVFGTLLTNLIIVKESKLEKLALGYILGLGIFTFILFLCNLLGLSYSLKNSVLILTILIFITFTANLLFNKLSELKFNNIIKSIYTRFINLSGVEKIIVTTILMLCMFSLVSNLYWPIKEWDAVVLYDFRAKLFTKTGFMDEAASLGYFSGYPLLTSLTHTWTYLVGASNPKFVYSIFYISFIVLFYILSKKAGMKQATALVSTLILSATSIIFDHSQFAYTNLPYTTYLFLSFAYSYLWIKNAQNGYLIISLTLVALSTWTRFAEPFWLPIILFISVYALYKRKIFIAVFYPLTIIILRYPWRQYVKNLGMGDPATEQGVGTMFKTMATDSNQEQIFSVMEYLWSNVLSKNILIIVMFACVMFVVPKIIKKRDFSLMYTFSLIVADFAILVFGTWIYSLSQPYWKEIGDSANRMMMFLTPLILFCVFLVINKYLITNKAIKLK